MSNREHDVGDERVILELTRREAIALTDWRDVRKFGVPGNVLKKVRVALGWEKS